MLLARAAELVRGPESTHPGSCHLLMVCGLLGSHDGSWTGPGRASLGVSIALPQPADAVRWIRSATHDYVADASHQIRFN